MPPIKWLFIALPLYSHYYCSRLTGLTGLLLSFRHSLTATGQATLLLCHISYTFIVAISLVNSRYFLLYLYLLSPQLFPLSIQLPLSRLLTGTFCLIPLTAFSQSFLRYLLSDYTTLICHIYFFSYITPSFSL